MAELTLSAPVVLCSVVVSPDSAFQASTQYPTQKLQQQHRLSLALPVQPQCNRGEKVLTLNNRASPPLYTPLCAKVLETDASQQDVFNAAVKDVVDDVLKGYNGTVMAYGQTGKAFFDFMLSSAHSQQRSWCK